MLDLGKYFKQKNEKLFGVGIYVFMNWLYYKAFFFDEFGKVERKVS